MPSDISHICMLLIIIMKDGQGRLEVLNIHTRGMKLGTSVKLGSLAHETHGFGGADLAELWCEAAMQSIQEKIDLVDAEASSIDVEILEIH